MEKVPIVEQDIGLAPFRGETPSEMALVPAQGEPERDALAPA
jgi:hypothetical protein